MLLTTGREKSALLERRGCSQPSAWTPVRCPRPQEEQPYLTRKANLFRSPESSHGPRRWTPGRSQLWTQVHPLARANAQVLILRVVVDKDKRIRDDLFHALCPNGRLDLEPRAVRSILDDLTRRLGV
jgi:hypothetical protein